MMIYPKSLSLDKRSQELTFEFIQCQSVAVIVRWNHRDLFFEWNLNFVGYLFIEINRLGHLPRISTSKQPS
jgi:hypothetical protein